LKLKGLNWLLREDSNLQPFGNSRHGCRCLKRERGCPASPALTTWRCWGIRWKCSSKRRFQGAML
jgi:hypothetical protein